jgi:hypothetical protein
VHWTPAVVLEKPTGKKGETWRVGLADGRVLPLAIETATAQRKLTKCPAGGVGERLSSPFFQREHPRSLG